MSRIGKKLRKTKEIFTDAMEARVAPWRKNVLFKDINIPDVQFRCPRLLVFAHYSSDGSVHPYVYRYLESMRSANCDVLFVSSSGILRVDALEKLKAIVAGVIIRNNFGYDFASWWTAVQECPGICDDYPVVLFANDSVYGPFGHIEKILSLMESKNLDLWSLTSSMERTYHLQSYFWAVSNEGLRGGFFKYFWGEYYRAVSRRQKVIDQYELKLAQIAEEQFGLKVGAYLQIEELMELSHQRLLQDMHRIADWSECNPLLHLGCELLKDDRVPFVKRELLYKDPFGLKCYGAIGKIIESKDSNLWCVIEDHLHSIDAS